MIRKEKEITEIDEINAILDSSQICRIAMSDNDMPYIIPMNFCRTENSIFIHSAKSGKKIEILKKNNRVCIETEAYCELKKSDKPCSTGMKFKSVVASGTAEIITDPDVKLFALNLFTKKYTSLASYIFSEKDVSGVEIIKISISEITGKKSL